jgi:hypothetical protein
LMEHGSRTKSYPANGRYDINWFYFDASKRPAHSVKKPRKRGQEAENIELTINYSGIPVYLRASA